MPSSPESFRAPSLFCRTLLQQAFEVVGAIDLGHQVAQLVAGLEQLLERGTCCTSWPGSKSSIDLNLSCTAISLPSPARVFLTRILRPGVMRAITSSKLSRSIWTNLRSFSGLRGWVGFPEKSPRTPTTNGSSLSTGAFGLDLVVDVHAGLAHALKLVVYAGH